MYISIYPEYDIPKTSIYNITGCKLNKRHVGLIAPPFKINFLATENWKKSVRILLKIIHLASGSHIWSFFAQNHMLTKSKSRSIASKITNLASRKSYIVIILPNSYQKLTKSKTRSSWSRFKHCIESLVYPIGSHMWSLYVPIHIKSWSKAKLGQVEVGSNIAQNRLFSQ